jgi:endonuclease/exonuclease/phosphatase family metal-dependent hydrolase
VALLALAGPALTAAPIRVTTWNLEWFPNGTPKELPVAEQNVRIAAAADVIRPLNPDIILLQEIKDLDACTRLAEAIRPNTYHVAICSAFRDATGIGKQQVAVMAKQQAQAAWAESWKAMNGVDPPRGFAFAYFKIGGADVGVYSLHLKSNLVMHGDKAAEGQKNRLKREVSIEQVLSHIRNDIPKKLPTVKSFVVGGDFNTNLDQPEFAGETTITKLVEGGFRSAMEGIPQFERITHPGSGHYPDATFDYLLGYNLAPGKLQIIESDASDHLPVTCDFTPGGGNFAATNPAPATTSPAPAPPTNVAPLPTKPPGPQVVTLTQPVKIKILYGETTLPRGLKLEVVSRSGQTVVVKYLQETAAIPISATDLQ